MNTPQKPKIYLPHIKAKKAARTHLYRVLYGDSADKTNNTPWMDSTRVGGKPFSTEGEFHSILNACQFSSQTHINRLKLRQAQLGG